MSSEALCGFQQFAVFLSEESRYAVKQHGMFEFDTKWIDNSMYPLANISADFFQMHARHETHIELQIAVPANSVGIITAMNAAQIQSRVGDVKQTALISRLELLPIAHEIRNHGVHCLHSIIAQARVG